MSTLILAAGQGQTVVVDAAMVAAIGGVLVASGTFVGAIAAGIALLIRTLREPVKADLLTRVETLETKVTGFVRHYHQQQLKAAAEGYVLEALPAELLA